MPRKISQKIQKRPREMRAHHRCVRRGGYVSRSLARKNNLEILTAPHFFLLQNSGPTMASIFRPSLILFTTTAITWIVASNAFVIPRNNYRPGLQRVSEPNTHPISSITTFSPSSSSSSPAMLFLVAPDFSTVWSRSEISFRVFCNSETSGVCCSSFFCGLRTFFCTSTQHF